MPGHQSIDVRRLGTATFQTPDLGRMLDYYTAIMGLSVVEQGRQRAVLATAQGQEAVVLEQSDRTGLSSLSFQVSPATDLRALASVLSEAGIASQPVSDPTPGVARALRFSDPKGTTVDLFSDGGFAARDKRGLAVMPLKLGHVAFQVVDIHACVGFYTDMLGFRVSDWRQDAAYFLRCSPDHHTVNFFVGDRVALHHLAFELNDWSELHRACDFLARQGRILEWGPSRHHVGHNIACYHRDDDGTLVELYTELDQMKDEALGYFDPRPWHEDMPQRPKAWPADTSTNYWGVHQIRAEKRDRR